MKQQVIAYLKSNRQFAGGVQLYHRLPGHSMAFARRLNIEGESPRLLQQLYYELAKIVGINETAMQGYLQSKIATVQATEKPADVEPGIAQEIQALLEEDDYRSIEDKIQELEIETPTRKKEDYRQALLHHLTHLQQQQAQRQLPQKVREAVKLRQQFPFLREKDCPEELKILVSDRISAYHRYVAEHKKLHENLKEEEIAAAAQDVVENFLENKLIFRELEHYQEHGRPLGEHPIWENRKALEEIQKLGVKELIKKKNSLGKGISTDQKKIDAERQLENPDASKIEKWSKALASKEFQMQEVNRLLDQIDQK